MNEFFGMLTTIAKRRKASSGSPFASEKTAERWLRRLALDSDYDTHHALVEGLERFNAERGTATLARMKVLQKLEAFGLPLQQRIVEQYVRNQATFRLARQALWRESWMFWSLLAEAWLDMLKQAYRNGASLELKPHVAEIATRALRYAGLVMRWDYHQARDSAPSAWRRVHKIFRLVERDGFARQEVMIDDRASHCAREYALVVLMGLVHPVGFRAHEIESIARLLADYEPLPLPTAVPSRESCSHVVDLSLSEGASLLDGECVRGRRLRYFALNELIAHLKSLDSCDAPEVDNVLTRQVASLMERGGIRRHRQRTHRFGRVWVAAGIDKVMTALATPAVARSHAGLDAWMLRDESMEGMGFVLPEPQAQPHGRLIAVSWDPTENVWQLLAVRWMREEGSQQLLGAQRLSRHPRRVEVLFDTETEGAAEIRTWALFMPLAEGEQGVSNLLLPKAHYRLGAGLTLRDGDVLYRLRLGEVEESHEDWVRVGMDVLGRELFAAAA
ncbi:MAG: hypothetical protein ACLGG4_03300 [Gammaproteobacteria bacterium]